MTADPSPLTEHNGALLLAVKVTPGAAQSKIQGVAAGGTGGPVLRITVTAAPEKGKANKAVTKCLATALGLPKTSLTVISGATDRHKVIGISGDTTALKQKVSTWLGTLPGPEPKN